MPFGLPQRAPDPQPVLDTLVDNEGNIQVVVAAFADDIGRTELTNQEMIDGINRAVRKALTARVGANTRSLDSVMVDVAAALQSAMSTNDTELGFITSFLDANVDTSTLTQPETLDAEGNPVVPVGADPSMNPAAYASADNQVTVDRSVTAEKDEGFGAPVSGRVDIVTVNVPATEYELPAPAQTTVPITPATAPDWPGPGDVIHSTWIQRFTAVRDWLVASGRVLLGLANAVNVDTLKRLLELPRLFEVDDAVYKAAQRHYENTLQSPAFAVALQIWHGAVVNKLCAGSENIVALLAMRSYLHMCESVRYHVSGDNTDAKNSDSSLGLHLFGLGGAVTQTEHLGSGASASGDMAPLIVPALDMIDTCIAYELQQEPPTVAEAEVLWTRGYITDEEAEVIVRCNGQHWQTVRAAMIARAEHLSPHDAIEYTRRLDLPADTREALLQQGGFADPFVRDALNTLYDTLPTISDHLTWLRRNVFDNAYVQQYDLLNGFDDKFWAKFGHDLVAQGMKKEYAALHYAAHWIQPAPTQMLEFVYRLRPGKVPQAQQFTLQDYQNILAEQDYAPRARAWFAATAYQVPALGYLRDMFRQGIIDPDQLKSYHQDLGYSPDDAQHFLDIDTLLKVRDRRNKSQGWTPGALARAYGAGQVLPLTVVTEMGQMGYTPDESSALMERATAEVQARIITRARSRIMYGLLTEVRDHVRTGIVSEAEAVNLLVSAGYSTQLATSQVQIELAESKAVLIKAAVGRLKTAYLSGALTAAQVAQSLQTLQLTPQSITQYVSLWTIMLTPKRKHRSASQVVESLAHGDIDRQTALTMLTNLGYDDADQRLYLADAQRSVAKLQQARQAAQLKQANARAKALQAAAKAASKAKQSIVKDLMKEAPPGTLKRWARLGIITKGDFYARFKLYGYPGATIDAYWLDACSSRTAACNESAAITTPVATVSGLTGGTT